MSGNVLGSAVLELRTDDTKLTAGIERARAQAQALTGNLTATERSAAKTGSAFDNVGRQAGNAGSKMGDAGRQASSAGNSFNGLGGILGGINAKSVLAVAGVTSIGLAAVNAGKAAIAAGMDYEMAFTGVVKTVNATEVELEALNAGIRQMAREVPVAATEIANVASAAGQLGIKTEHILGFTRVMIDLGVSTNMSAEQAATSLARLANITQMPQENFDRLGSTVVALGNNFATTEAEIVSMALRIAAAGNQIGLSEAEILGFAAALSSLGIEAEAGGTAISRVMIEIANAVASGGEKLEMFASVAGMSVEEFQRLFREDASTAINTFIAGLDQVSTSGGNLFAVLEELGMSEIRVRDALLRTAGGGDILRESLDLATDSFEENIARTKEAELFYGTTANKLVILKNHLKEVAIGGFDLLSPAINDSIDMLIEFAASIPPVLEKLDTFISKVQELREGPVSERAGLEGFLADILEFGEDIGEVLNYINEFDDDWPTLAQALGWQEAHVSDTEAHAERMIAAIEEVLGISIVRYGSATDALIAWETQTGISFQNVDAVYKHYIGVTEEVAQANKKMLAELQQGLLEDPGKGMTGLDNLSLDLLAVRTEWVDTAALIRDEMQATGRGFQEFGNLSEMSFHRSSVVFDGFATAFRGSTDTALSSIESIASAAASGALDFGDAMSLYADIPRTELATAIEETAANIRGKLADATLSEEDRRHVHAQLEALRIIFPDLVAEIDGTVTATDRWARSLGTLGGIQDAFQANIAYSAGRVSEWEGHLKGAETALGFLQDKIDAGIPLTAKEAEQYEILSGAVERYTGGINDEMAGLVAAEVAKAKYIAAQDNLNAAIERGESNLEPYKQAMRDAVAEMDPAALAAMGLVDAQDKLIGAIEGVVGQIRDLMIALGLIPPDTDVNINGDATDAITAATITRDELNLIPAEKNIGFTADESGVVIAAGVVKSEIELVPSTKEIGFTADTHGAVYDIDGLTKKVDGVPSPKNIDITATDNASDEIGWVQDRLNRLPNSFTVYINADAAGFYATVQGVDNYIPRSPAKEGPFSRVPDWSFMWEGLPIAAGYYWDKTMEELTGVEGDLRTVGELQTAAWADGIQATGPAVIDAATSIAGETSTAVVEELGGGRQFQSETFLTQLNQFSEFILNTVIASATEFEADLIDAASGYMEATQAAVGLLSDSLELMASLQSANTDLDRAKEAASAVKFLTEHVVKSIGDSAAYLDATNPEGFVTRAEEYAMSAQSGVDLMTAGAEAMALLSNLIYNLDQAKQAASDIKFLTEHIMLSLGDSAEYIIHHRDAGFVPLAADYAEYAGKGVELMTSGAELLATLSGLSADLDRAKSAASDVKFLTEHIVLSIGDSAAYIAGTRGPGFIEHTRTYAEAALAALTLMGQGVETFGLLEQFEGDLEIARTSASDIKFLIEHIVQSVGDSASLFNTGFLEHISTFVTAASDAQGLMVEAVDTVAAMLEYGAMPTGGIDLRARAAEMVELVRMITAEMQTAAVTFETSGLSAIESFSSAADAGMATMGNAGDALEAILMFALVDTSGYDLASMSQNMVDLIVLVTQNMEAAAAHFETKGLEAVERFSSAAGAGLGTMSQAGEALASILMYGEMTPEERDNLKQLAWEFTGVMDYLISMIQQVASNYNTDALEALTKFAGDATKSLNLIKTAADAFKAMVDHSRVTQQHADDFVRSWEVMVWTLQEIAQMVSNQGVQEAIRILNANQEIFSLLTEAFNLHQQSLGMSAEMGGGSSPAPSASTPAPVSTGSTAMPVTGNTPKTTGSGSSSSSSVWERTFGMTKAEWIAAGKPQLEMLASGGVVEKDTIARIGEGNLREAVIPLDNGGASLVAKELVDRMRAAPGWASMGASIAIPTSLLNPWQQRGGGDDVEVNFNAPVTINARDREDAERAMADVAWGVQAARKRRGR